MPFWKSRKQKPSKKKRNDASSCSRKANKQKQVFEDDDGTTAPVAPLGTTSKGETIEIENFNVTTIHTDNNQEGIGNLYRRCCDFELLGDTSSSEDNTDKENRTGVEQGQKMDSATIIGFGSCSSSEDDDEDVSFLTTSMKDVHVTASLTNISSFSVEPDTDSTTNHDTNSAIQNSKHPIGFGGLGNKAAFGIARRGRGASKQPSLALLSNVISIDDDSDSSHDSNHSLARGRKKKPSAFTTDRPTSLDERIDALEAGKKNVLDCEHSNNNKRHETRIGDASDSSLVPFSSSLSEKIETLTKPHKRSLSPHQAFGTSHRRAFRTFGNNITIRRRRPCSAFRTGRGLDSDNDTNEGFGLSAVIGGGAIAGGAAVVCDSGSPVASVESGHDTIPRNCLTGKSSNKSSSSSSSNNSIGGGSRSSTTSSSSSTTERSALASPFLGRPTKSKRISIVDLCSP
mmetsp:Transcript_39308/g.82277  ORF Transcript_39308/g.82277 Transcript_39308/m.82277 type:complete len:457 (+) Transcript_39308:1-1371(+)